MTMHYRTTVTAGDGFDFVISDGSMDRHGTRINPDGWDLSEFRRNPVALWAHGTDPVRGRVPIGRWANLRITAGKLMGTLILADEGSSGFVDELRRLVLQGILRAVSVGMDYIQPGKLGGKWEIERAGLREVSLVSVGSNSNALALARSLEISESTICTVFGEDAREDDVIVHDPGKQAAQTASIEKRNSRMDTPLTKRIENAQNDLNAARDALTDHLADDNADTEQTELLSVEIEQREERLASLKRAEKALASRAAGGDDGDKPAKPSLRKPLGVKLREPKPGDLMIRAGVINALAFITQRDPIKVLEERYGDHEATNVFVRAAVDPAKTTVSGWAAELIETEVLSFLESLKPVSIFPRLAEMGLSLNFGPGRAALKIPSRTASPSISGSFVAEGAPIPVRRIGLTSVTLTPHKLGVISYFTREIARLSNPQIESLIREYIQDDTAITLDTLLLDANAGSTTRPAGLTNGVSALTASTAGGYQAILEDIQTLAGPFDTANAGRRLALILNPREARLLKMTPGPNASGFGWADQFLSEFTVIRSTNVAAGHVYMIDAADFAAAVGSPEFDVSEQAILHAEDTSPAQIGTAGTPTVVAAPVISMFQTASIALRMLSDCTWAMRRTGMVQHIAAVDWAPAP